MHFRLPTVGRPYGESTHHSGFWLKRWLHRKRFAETIELLRMVPHQSVLDYGAGDGYLLLRASAAYPQSELWGFEPAGHMIDTARRILPAGGVHLSDDRTSLPAHHFDVVLCLETAEHLPDPELQTFFSDCSRVLKSGGFVIVSVPIEIGLPALLKNIYRGLRLSGYEGLTFSNTLRAVLGLPIERNAQTLGSGTRYIHSHLGFNHRRFEQKLRRLGTIKRRFGTPAPMLGTFINNSVYYLVRVP